MYVCIGSYAPAVAPMGPDKGGRKVIKKDWFGSRRKWIKRAIYNSIIKDKDFFGINAIKIKKDKEKLSEEEIGIRYKLVNLIKYKAFDYSLDPKDIMAVLYNINFEVCNNGRLWHYINYDNEKYRQQFEQVEQDIEDGLV